MYWESEKESLAAELINFLYRKRFLDSLILGGSALLNLHYNLPRPIKNLDFWFYDYLDDHQFFLDLKEQLNKHYDVIDGHLKRKTILFELRKKPRFPRYFIPDRAHMIIKIRRGISDIEYEYKHCSFKYILDYEILVRLVTLREALRNKIQTLLRRGAIRDAFDIEFLIRKDVPLPELSEKEIQAVLERIRQFKPNDFKVTLGSLVEPDLRAYYLEHGFHLLETHLIQRMNN